MSTKVLRGAVVVLTLVAAQAFGQATSAPCPGCSLQQAQDLAHSMGAGLKLIYDVPGLALTYWSVSVGRTLRDRETGLVEVIPGGVERLPVPATVSAAFRYALQAPSQTEVSFQPGGPNDPSYPELPNPVFNLDYTSNAFAHALDPGRRANIENRLSNWIHGAPAPGELMAAYRGLVAALAGTRYITVTITYADGSREQYRVNRLSTNEYQSAAQYIAGSATDRNGNPIPEPDLVNDPGGGDLYEGTFEFSNGYDLERWIQAMEAAGVPVTGSCRTRVGCVRIGDGQWHCGCS